MFSRELLTSLIDKLPKKLQAVYQELQVDGPPDFDKDTPTLAFGLALAASVEFLLGDHHPSERDIILNSLPVALDAVSVETMRTLFMSAYSAIEKIEDALLAAAAPTPPPYRLAVPDYFDDVVGIYFRREKQKITLFVRVHEKNQYSEPIEQASLVGIKSLISQALSS